MLRGRIIDGEGKFASECNKASREVSAGDGRGVPSVKQKQNGLLRDAHRVPFVAQNGQALVEVAIDSFDDHGVVVIPGQDMAVNFYQCSV